MLGQSDTKAPKKDNNWWALCTILGTWKLIRSSCRHSWFKIPFIFNTSTAELINTVVRNAWFCAKLRLNWNKLELWVPSVAFVPHHRHHKQGYVYAFRGNLCNTTRVWEWMNYTLLCMHTVWVCFVFLCSNIVSEFRKFTSHNAGLPLYAEL